MSDEFDLSAYEAQFDAVADGPWDPQPLVDSNSVTVMNGLLAILKPLAEDMHRAFEATGIMACAYIERATGANVTAYAHDYHIHITVELPPDFFAQFGDTE
jgi:hypothetical protein